MSLRTILQSIFARLSEIERRISMIGRQGEVAEVDPAKASIRLKIGKGPDGQDVLSPWLPYAQIAGALKIHAPPSVGQQMFLVPQGGDINQSVAIPLSWSNAQPSPDTTTIKNVMTFGQVRIEVEGEKIFAKVGTAEFEHQPGMFRGRIGSSVQSPRVVVTPEQAKIRFGDAAVWIDVTGIWSTVAVNQKPDPFPNV